MITLAEYYMGRDREFPEEFEGANVEHNAKFLLHQVNGLLKSLNIDNVEVRSGWRPRVINEKVGGSSRSYHLVGRAIDIADPLGGLGIILSQNPEKLRAHQLWLEDPQKTKTWIHLDNGIRKDRESRIFLP
ncbi:MAG: hypothetical protein E6Q97_26810 [Desulfurellales bacterium]|nr:MAG: hypothetical protein E6Q97_26810 [Desulfurellales bacterium]